MKIVNWKNLTDVQKKTIISRPIFLNDESVGAITRSIIQQVREGGDQALIDLTLKYDQIQISALQVSQDELQEAFKKISMKEREALEFAKKQISICHQAQLLPTQVVEPCEGVSCARECRPIKRIGLYIPGGSAPLVSTVLMLGVPAQIAGGSLRILCTPPNVKGEIDARILVAAQLCGITEIYKVGGAQAIAAMAYGTQSIPKVDKIFGPGNSWVTQAKVQVAQDPDGASIDMPAGPSEVLVIADDKANPEFVAADLLSQAEHGVDSQVILLALSESFALRVARAVQEQVITLPRYLIAKQSLENSSIIIVDTIEQAIAVSNDYAPEHLILQMDNCEQYTSLIQNAGAVFLGKWTPEVVGDYVTGSNHVLPTYGYARSISGLSVMDFMKWINFQKVTQKGLKKIGVFAERLADIEGLQAHKKAVSLRLTEEEIVNNE